MNAPQTSSLTGRHVGRYRIGKHLASGGMGAVYEVVQDSIGHRAAMKVLSSGLTSDPKHKKYVDRFLDEARAVNLINHPGVLQIFDFGEMEDHNVYILMEFIEGKSLADFLSQFRQGTAKRMALVQIVRIMRQVASVLSVAHEKGVLHRDIKPSNVMLLSDPTMPGGQRAKVIDFGLAKFLDTPERRTTAGMTVGTAQYMSPEQCLGEENFDGKVDVYALGAMLYELLSGDPPFQGEAGAIMRKHVNEAPRPLQEVASNVPASLSKLTHRMLDKRKEARPTMTEVEAELGKLEESDEIKQASATFIQSTGGAVDVMAPTTKAPSMDRNDKTSQVPSKLHPPKPGWIAALIGIGILLGAVLGGMVIGRSKPAVPPPAPPVVCPEVPPAPPVEKTAKPVEEPAAPQTAADTKPAGKPGKKGRKSGLVFEDLPKAAKKK